MDRARAARWPRWKKRSSPWSAAASASELHAERQDPATGKLPVYHVFLGGREHWFVTREELDDFVAEQEEAAGGKLNVDVGRVGGTPSVNGDELAEAARLRIVELHEVRTINTALADLAKLGFAIDALIPQERTGEETRATCSAAARTKTGLEDLRGLPGRRSARPAKRACTITRFKGLGEMNAEELRDTTLDPANRTLLQVTHGRRRRRRRPVPRPDGRQGRTPPRVHREARAGCAEFGCVKRDSLHRIRASQLFRNSIQFYRSEHRASFCVCTVLFLGLCGNIVNEELAYLHSGNDFDWHFA